MFQENNEAVSNLSTRLDQTNQQFAAFQAQSLEVQDQHQLKTMVRFNNSLRRELLRLGDSVDAERQAVQDLSKFMISKNNVTDALVMIMRDFEKHLNKQEVKLKQIDFLQNELVENVDKLVEDYEGISDKVAYLDNGHSTLRNTMNDNTTTIARDLKDLKSWITENVQDNLEYREKLDKRVQELSNGNPESRKLGEKVGSMRKEVSGLRKAIEKIFSTRLFELEAKLVKLKSCNCDYHNTKLDYLEKKVNLIKGCKCSTSLVGSRLDALEDAMIKSKRRFTDHEEEFNMYRDERYRNEMANEDLAERLEDFVTNQELSEALIEMKNLIENLASKCGAGDETPQPVDQIELVDDLL